MQVTDTESPAQGVAVQFDLQVNAGITQLSIVTTTLPQGAQNVGYNTMLAATGGITPYTWSVVAGTLPLGLQLNTSTGAITGTAEWRRCIELHRAGGRRGGPAGHGKQSAEHHHQSGRAVTDHHYLAAAMEWPVRSTARRSQRSAEFIRIPGA